MAKHETVYPEKCLNHVGFRRCGINFYPTEPHALKDLNPYDLEDAKENRVGPCGPGSFSCYPKYSKDFERLLGIRSRWVKRAAKDIN